MLPANSGISTAVLRGETNSSKNTQATIVSEADGIEFQHLQQNQDDSGTITINRSDQEIREEQILVQIESFLGTEPLEMHLAEDIGKGSPDGAEGSQPSSLLDEYPLLSLPSISPMNQGKGTPPGSRGSSRNHHLPNGPQRGSTQGMMPLKPYLRASPGDVRDNSPEWNAGISPTLHLSSVGLVLIQKS